MVNTFVIMCHYVLHKFIVKYLLCMIIISKHHKLFDNISLITYDNNYVHYVHNKFNVLWKRSVQHHENINLILNEVISLNYE